MSELLLWGQKQVLINGCFVAARLEKITAIWIHCNFKYRHKAGVASCYLLAQ
jgi:hypothetical protein